MIALARLMALVMLVIGIIFIVNPKSMKPYLAFWKKGKRMRIGGIVNIIIGIVFLKISSGCGIPMVLIILGIMSTLKGIVLLVAPPEKTKAMLSFWENKSEKAVRGGSIIVIIMALLLLKAI